MKDYPMHWNFTFEEQPLVLYAKISGELRKEDIAKMSIEGIMLARSKNCNKFIVDYRNAVLVGSEMDIYETNTNLEKTGLTRTDRIAVLINRDIPSFRFAETVSGNRGWRQLKYFENEAEARDWING
jgi:hypothetical protein